MIHSGSLSRDSIGSMHHINFEVADIHAAHGFALTHGAKVPPGFRLRVNACRRRPYRRGSPVCG
jgi:hypothetical protein